MVHETGGRGVAPGRRHTNRPGAPDPSPDANEPPAVAGGSPIHQLHEGSQNHSAPTTLPPRVLRCWQSTCRMKRTESSSDPQIGVPAVRAPASAALDSGPPPRTPPPWVPRRQPRSHRKPSVCCGGSTPHTPRFDTDSVGAAQTREPHQLEYQSPRQSVVIVPGAPPRPYVDTLHNTCYGSRVPAQRGHTHEREDDIPHHRRAASTVWPPTPTTRGERSQAGGSVSRDGRREPAAVASTEQASIARGNRRRSGRRETE